MKTVVYSMHHFERSYLSKYNNGKHELIEYDIPLDKTSAYLARGCRAVSLFVTDDGSSEVLDLLKQNGVEFITLRSAGFNHVDIEHAGKIGLKVSFVPEYSPYAVAEHAVALLMALNRKLIVADRKVKYRDFSIDDLIGFDLHGETVGVIGTGRIGGAFAKIMHGFGCRVLAYDLKHDESLVKYYSVKYTSLNSLLKQSRVVSLHIPLTAATHYLINEETIQKMQNDAILLNTSRGAIIDTAAVLNGLENEKIAALGIDVYENEKGLFFEDHSHEILKDQLLIRLMAMKNVIITSHQGFLTDTALRNIARETVKSLDNFSVYGRSQNEIPLHTQIIK